MFDKLARPLKDRVLKPLAGFMAKYMSPNFITLLSFISGLGSIYFILYGQLTVALMFWTVNRILDGLDGAVARIGGRQSDFGGYLDILADFFIYALIPFSFALAFGQDRAIWIYLALMLGLFYINGASWMYLSALLEKRRAGSADKKEQTSITMPSGLVEGTETIIIYTLFYLLPHRLDWLFAVMSIMLIPGIAYRLIWAWKNLT